MKNLFLTFADRDYPSSRIRAWNIADHWDDATCQRWSNDINLEGFDNIILQKLPFPETLELAKKYFVYLDLCDPEWWLPATKKIIQEYLPYLKDVVVSSEALRDDFEKTFNYRPFWIDDRHPFIEDVREHEEFDRPTLVWFGSTFNRAPCLNTIGETFHRLIGEGINFKLLIIDSKPDVPYLKEKWCFHIKWHRLTLHGLLCASDIALLPSYPGPWGRMKSNNRKATAYWAGLPVHDGIDYHSLKRMILDYKLRQQIGLRNRVRAIIHFDINQSIDQWQRLLLTGSQNA